MMRRAGVECRLCLVFVAALGCRAPDPERSDAGGASDDAGMAGTDSGATSIDAGSVVLNPPNPSPPLPNGPYSVDLFSEGATWSVSGWLPGTGTLANQGLWVARTQGFTPSGVRWSQLLSDAQGPVWRLDTNGADLNQHVTGLYAPSMVVAGDERWLFYHFVNRVGATYVSSVARARLPSACF